MTCSKVGHLSKVCHQQKTVKVIEDKNIDGIYSDENETYQLNIWKIKLSQNVPKFNILKKHDFKKHLFINNQVVNILIGVSAKFLVCGMTQAKSWGILDKSKFP